MTISAGAGSVLSDNQQHRAFAPGEAFQFDWSEDWAYIGGERIKLQVAHIKLSHSRAFLVRAYLLQTHEMLFDGNYSPPPFALRNYSPPLARFVDL